MKLIYILTIALALISFGCSENINTKGFGGKMTINLPANKKLVNATWKDTELWYLTRAMNSNEFPEVYNFVEKSTYGVWEGEVVFVESK